MKGVLIVAHGSRVDSTIHTINEVVNMVRTEIRDQPLEIAYMEFCQPNIAQGIEALAKQGVDHIKVVPYFLFDGIHIREDIPNEIHEILKGYPHITLEIGKTLGVDHRLAEILIDRINH